MKTQTSILLLAAVLITSLVVWSQNSTHASSNSNTTSTAMLNTSSQAKSAQPQQTQQLHLPKGFSADQAYKANCTRCHAEVPKMDEKRTSTSVRHMRVRANLTKDEAEAILQYLNR